MEHEHKILPFFTKGRFTHTTAAHKKMLKNLLLDYDYHYTVSCFVVIITEVIRIPICLI
jgi:hypothetical protein